jgi:hypothetical protein
MFTTARASVLLMLVLLGALFDEASRTVQAQPPPACDALCRQRSYFYDCTTNGCLNFSEPDCFCCNRVAGSLCKPVPKEENTSAKCTVTTTPITVSSSSSCSLSCTCGKAYVEASGGTYSMPTSWYQWTCPTSG